MKNFYENQEVQVSRLGPADPTGCYKAVIKGKYADGGWIIEWVERPDWAEFSCSVFTEACLDSYVPDTRPYNESEKRVCDYIKEITNNQIGCGNDPIGFLIASHASLSHQLKTV